MEDTFPAESEYPAVADAVEEEEEEEDDEEEAVAEAPPVVVVAAAKKRGRPAGSKNRAPDVYTAILDRMTQLEETLTRRPPPPQSSTGGTPEDPPPAVATKPKRQARPRRVAVEAPPATSQVDLLMDQITQAREARRQQQLSFYATFLPN